MAHPPPLARGGTRARDGAELAARPIVSRSTIDHASISERPVNVLPSEIISSRTRDASTYSMSISPGPCYTGSVPQVAQQRTHQIGRPGARGRHPPGLTP